MMPMDHTSPLYCIACHYEVLGTRYLSAIELHNYGEAVHGWFSQFPSCAIPLSLDQAERLKAMMESDVPKNTLRIMPVPWNVEARK